MFLIGCESEPRSEIVNDIFETCFSKDRFFEKNEFPDHKYAGIIEGYIAQDGGLDSQSPPHLSSPYCSNVKVGIDAELIEEKLERRGKIEITKRGERAFCAGDVCGLRNLNLNMVFVGNGKLHITNNGNLRFEITGVKQLEPEDSSARLANPSDLDTYVRLKQGEMKVVNPNFCLIDCDK